MLLKYIVRNRNATHLVLRHLYVNDILMRDEITFYCLLGPFNVNNKNHNKL